MREMTVHEAADSPADAVERALAGEDDAFREIVGAYAADMRQVAYVVTGDLELAREAVAAAWPIAWRRLRTLRDHAALRPWLVAIAANEARHLSRRHRTRAVREIPLDAIGPSAGVAADLDRTGALDLARALNGLAPDDRTLLALRYVAGLNSTELAHATGLSASGTRARLQRLLARLRTELAE